MFPSIQLRNVAARRSDDRLCAKRQISELRRGNFSSAQARNDFRFHRHDMICPDAIRVASNMARKYSVAPLLRSRFENKRGAIALIMAGGVIPRVAR